MHFAFRLLIYFHILLIGPASWALEIPDGLSRDDLDEVINTLGIETSAKFLSDPYPLGGQSGFEIGFSSEFIDTADLARLGNGLTAQQKEDTFQYNRISFGKGLYHNIDLFFHFVPYSSSNDLSEYGGAAKWTFYEAQRLPVSISFLGHASTLNFDDRYINESIGWNIISGLNLRNFAIYFGGGSVRARSTFNQVLLDLGDPNNNLNDENTLIVKSQHAHSLVGVQAQLKSLFLAAQIDRYEHPVYSGKIGIRF